eukprot:912485-Rhodomonas_salina.1
MSTGHLIGVFGIPQWSIAQHADRAQPHRVEVERVGAEVVREHVDVTRDVPVLLDESVLRVHPHALVPSHHAILRAPFAADVHHHRDRKVGACRNVQHFVTLPRPRGLFHPFSQATGPAVGLQVGLRVVDIERHPLGAAQSSAVDQRALAELVHPVVAPREDFPVSRQRQ